MSPAFESVRAVVFDLDDTLCAYWEAATIGLRSSFAAHPEHGLSVDDMLLKWGEVYRHFAPTVKSTRWLEDYLRRGETTRLEQMRRTLASLGIKNEALARRLSDTYASERDRALRLFPESLSVLEALKGKFALALLTNGPADIQRQEIATLGIGSFFAGIYIEGEMGRGKPSQSVFRRIASEMGFSPAELTMVGNSYEHDIRPAIRAGWRTVWIRRASDVAPSADPEHAHPENRPEDAPAPTAEIGDLRELLSLLGM